MTTTETKTRVLNALLVQTHSFLLGNYIYYRRIHGKYDKLDIVNYLQ